MPKLLNLRTYPDDDGNGHSDNSYRAADEYSAGSTGHTISDNQTLCFTMRICGGEIMYLLKRDGNGYGHGYGYGYGCGNGYGYGDGHGNGDGHGCGDGHGDGNGDSDGDGDGYGDGNGDGYGDGDGNGYGYGHGHGGCIPMTIEHLLVSLAAREGVKDVSAQD